MKMSVDRLTDSPSTNTVMNEIILEEEIPAKLSTREEMKKTIEAFPQISAEKSFKNGNITRKTNKNGTQESQKKVHFYDQTSPVEEIHDHEVDENSSASGEKSSHVIVAVISLLVATAAVAASINLYLVTISLRADLELLESRIFGVNESDSAKSLESKDLFNFFTKKTNNLQKELDLFSKWANHSACIDGHDFTSGDFCYRLLRFELDFWQAYEFCRKRDGNLAFADDLASWNQTVFFLLARGFRMKEVWTGVHKDSGGVWRYSDGRAAEFTRWARGNIFDEGDDCSQIRIDPVYNRIGMYDRRCSINPRPFLCRFKLKKS